MVYGANKFIVEKWITGRGYWWIYGSSLHLE